MKKSKTPLIKTGIENFFQTADGYFTVSVPVDEYGNPVRKTKDKYRYSYDGFVTHRMGKNEEVNGTVYSDRLYQWDGAKYDRLCKKHFGDESQYWYSRSPKEIEAFLRDWNDNQNLKLILVMEYCNVSSGYPLWRFDYHL